MREVYLLKHKFWLGISRVAFQVFQHSNYASYTARREASKRESS